MDQKEKIVEGATHLFTNYGIRSVSMDDVARELGMSKKTLYQTFSQKDELVTECCKWHIGKEISEFEEIEQRASNAIEEIHEISTCVRNTMQNMNPALMFDLQKYHADGWQEFLDFKHNVIRRTVQSNLERGVAEGYYRPEIKPEIIAKMRMEQVQTAFNPSVFPATQYNLIEVQMTILNHFIHGLLSEKGKKKLNEYEKTQS